MSIDSLQDKIRKLKNPSVIDFTVSKEQIPPHILYECASLAEAYGRFCRELLEGLKGIVPAVRFSVGTFALLGQQSIQMLAQTLHGAKELGFYVILDGIQILSPMQAKIEADSLFSPECDWEFDALVTSACIGSDGLKPFVAKIKQSDKALFAVLRTGNKSAAELQDLLAGPRLVHSAAADIVNRLGEPMPGRCGYNKLGGVAGASSADSLRTLRSKYNRVFLLLDGYDYPNANAKNCSFAFDKLGHGAAACAGSSVTAAWTEEGCEEEYVALAVEAAERMKKNLSRYVTIL